MRTRPDAWALSEIIGAILSTIARGRLIIACSPSRPPSTLTWSQRSAAVAGIVASAATISAGPRIFLPFIIVLLAGEDVGARENVSELHSLQLVDPFAHQVEAALPEGAVGHVDADLGEDVLRPRRAAVGEQAEVAGLEGLPLLLVAPVEGEHQELAEAVGVAVEGGLEDVRDRQ